MIYIQNTQRTTETVKIRKPKNLSKKMCDRSEQTLYQRRYIDGK